MPAAFSKEEYRKRTLCLRERMASIGIDAMLVLHEGNMNYLTGYEGFSDYVPQLALVLQDQEDPWLILRDMDIACADASSYLPQSHVLGYPEKYIASSELTAWQPIAKFVRERCKSSRIGVELSGKMLGVKGHAALCHSLEMSEFIDADGMVASLKAIKSPAELAYMEQAGKIVDRAMQIGRLAVSVGARECDVAASIQHALTAGTPEYPGWTSRSPLVTMPVGSPANAPHLTWTDGYYKMGCQTNFELGAVRHRYCCALSRTVFLGEPNARSRHVHEACLDGFLAAFEAIRTGVTSSEVERAFRREFDPRGVRKESRIGYSIGIDWVDGGPSFQEGDETVLQANMTFHLLIGIWERTDGYIFSETVCVTDDGAKSLNNVTRDLLVNC